MSRIDGTFAALRDRHAKALIPYITAGDPHATGTAAIMKSMAAAGADIIELGIPFSDPMADGPVIQKASERALARGIGMPQVLAIVREFRSVDETTPVVLMGYANPVERYGRCEGRWSRRRSRCRLPARGVHGLCGAAPCAWARSHLPDRAHIVF